jgi:uncharacterized protein YqgC (DUF456 family)
MIYAYALLLIFVNALFLFLQIVGLPGNWLMVLAATVFAYALPEFHVFSLGVLIAIVVLALIGEVLEFLTGAVGARKAGASRSAAAAAIFGAVVGGLVGTFALPIPVVGSLVGACGGAFVGAMGTELMLGRAWADSLRSGQGAAVGRLWGTVAKFMVGAAIWLVIAVAAFWP